MTEQTADLPDTGGKSAIEAITALLADSPEDNLFRLLDIDPETCDVRQFMAVKYFVKAWPRVAPMLPRVIACAVGIDSPLGL